MAVTEPSAHHGSKTDSQPQQSSSPSSSHAVPPVTPVLDKDCRACSGAQHMINSFKHLTGIRKAQEAAGAGGQRSNSSAAGGGLGMAAAAAYESQRASSSQTSHSDAPNDPAATSAYEPMPCPPETSELGTSSWTLLHTMAAYYPDQPTLPQKSLMRSFMEGLAEFYPCSICAEHLKLQIEESPPDVSNALALSRWLCKIHNEVNEMLGKPVFDCSKVMQRWKDGPADGSCG